MNRTRIEWVVNPDGSPGFTWNPVTGCKHGCAYCYAKKIADRFKPTKLETVELIDNDHLSNYRDDQKLWQADRIARGFPAGFLPTYYPHRLEEPLERKKPATIFVCSMADLFGKWVPGDWITQMFEIVAACPQHTFLLLTKNPAGYFRLFEADTNFYLGGGDYLENVWLGASATNQEQWNAAIHYMPQMEFKTFVSAEPLLGPIKPHGINEIDWLIIGADSNRGAEKPEPEWGLDLVESALLSGIPVFMKKNWPWRPSNRPYPQELPEVLDVSS